MFARKLSGRKTTPPSHSRKGLLTRFGSNRSGQVAILFAGALVPTVAVVGIAIDFARANLIRTKLQASVDAAAMAGATTAGSLAARETAAQNAFNVNAGSIPPAVTVSDSASATTSTVSVTASASMPTAFLKLMGHDQLTINAASSVSTGGKKLELALVLDTTGSMNDNNKLDELQAALPTILDVVMPTGHTDTRVSIVPFASYVNVGSSNRSNLTGRTDWPNAQCVLERKRGPRPNENPPTLNTNEFWIQTRNSSCSSTRPITPLTSNRATLDTALANLSASGATSGHLGIQWGWHTLSPLWSGRWPSGSAPVAYTDDSTVKALVILTDGNFTEYHRNPDRSSASCNGRNDCEKSRLEAKAYCDTIKSRTDSRGGEAVMIFTIGFGLEPESSYDGQMARDTMKYCASFDANDPNPDPEERSKHFYFPVTQEDLENAFRSIGDAVSEAITKPRFTN